MHWMLRPGTSDAEEVRTHDGGQELQASPASATAGAHRAGVRRGRDRRCQLRRELGQPRRHAPTTTRRSAVQEVVNGYPGLYRDVQTYLKERIEEVLTGARSRS